MHIVMRASQARFGSPWSLHRHARLVTELLSTLSRRYSVKVYEVSNNGNHLHLLVRAHYRHGFRTFLRVFAGQLAQRVTGAVKGRKLGGRFWDLPVFTRIVAFGMAYRRAKRYVIQNQLEADGTIPYQPRKNEIGARGRPR
jgi:REP element-mobilizing transposase RayT